MTERVAPTKQRSSYEPAPGAQRHFDGRVFFNPDGEPPRGLADLMKWQFGSPRAKWPKAWPSPHGTAHPLQRITDAGLRVTMVGHATMLLQAGGLNILTDPVWSKRVSPVSFLGPARVNAPGIAFDALPPIDVVLLSHNHYDHMDLATLKRLQERHDPQTITPLGNDRILARSVPKMRVSAHDWGERVEIGGGTTIHVEPAHHWSARGARDRCRALWGGFVVENDAGKIYFAGDTGFDGGRIYRMLERKHGGFRLALLPIGAYEPRWFMAPQHQNPQEAVEAMLLCRAQFAAGFHWGTFQLTNEPIDEPRQKLLHALRTREIEAERFRPMLPGEVWDVPSGRSGGT